MPLPERDTMIMVLASRVLVASVVVAGCGRIRFDRLGVGDANSDGTVSDSAPTLSCAGLAATCGPAGTSPCCTSPLVPGGTYYRSYDVATDGLYASTMDPATVSNFRLDTYEVTVGRFRQFVNAGLGTQTNPPPIGAGTRTLNGMANQGGWDSSYNASLTTNTAAFVVALNGSPTYQSWTDAPGANEALPINGITWFEAFAFCVWDGGFLPTEAEWNYAAAGGSEQRAYPWSNPPGDVTIDCSYANYSPSPTRCVKPPTGALNRVGSESPKGDGKWGQADLGGNVNEWTLDWYQSPYSSPCSDCAELTPTSLRVWRGGAFDIDASGLREAFRNRGTDIDRVAGLGVRCARAP
jgi:formylglycine-generating enzyme required for sulfatase activity